MIIKSQADVAGVYRCTRRWRSRCICGNSQQPSLPPPLLSYFSLPFFSIFLSPFSFPFPFSPYSFFFSPFSFYLPPFSFLRSFYSLSFLPSPPSPPPMCVDWLTDWLINDDAWFFSCMYNARAHTFINTQTSTHNTHTHTHSLFRKKRLLIYVICCLNVFSLLDLCRAFLFVKNVVVIVVVVLILIVLCQFVCLLACLLAL